MRWKRLICIHKVLDLHWPTRVVGEARYLFNKMHYSIYRLLYIAVSFQLVISLLNPFTMLLDVLSFASDLNKFQVSRTFESNSFLKWHYAAFLSASFHSSVNYPVPQHAWVLTFWLLHIHYIGTIVSIFIYKRIATRLMHRQTCLAKSNRNNVKYLHCFIIG